MKDKNKQQIIVIQIGARMHYAVPAILSNAGLLKLFYTDIHSNHLIFKLIKFIIPKRLFPKKLKRLLGRNLPNELDKKNVKDEFFSSLIWANNEKKLTSKIFNRVLKDNFQEHL